MSGHSKWAKIKRGKGAKDAQKGALFSRVSKKITIAAKAGGGVDMNMNFQLRSEVESARSQGMPNDNIERAIKKAFDKDAASITEITYEGYGPFGTAFLVEVATDNTNRAVQNIKHIFSKHGGSLGAMGSVAWMFESKGQILVERANFQFLVPTADLPKGSRISNFQNKAADFSELELTAIDAGAVDVRESEEGLEVCTLPQDLSKVKEALEKAGAKIVQAEIIKESSQGMDLTDEQKTKVESLFTDLEDYEDVVAVHTSANL